MRIAIYCRVSTEEQREGKNIDSQINELKEHARKQKGWEIVKEYTDEGWSGSLITRPDLDRLRDDAKKGLFDAVLINDVDRLGRDVMLMAVVMRDLEKAGVQVIFRKIPPENSPTYTLLLNILTSFAQFEREIISDRFRRGRRYKAEVKGQVVTNRGYYGVKYIPKDLKTSKEGYYKIIEEEIDVVKKMFQWIKEGMTERGVARKLKKLNIRARNGGYFGRSTVHKILTNEAYTGIWHYNKHKSVKPQNRLKPKKYYKRENNSQIKRPRDEWIPVPLPEHLRVISKKDFELVQRRLKENRVYSRRNTKNFYLLRGLLKCGLCGDPFYSDNFHGNPYYRCGNRRKKFPLEPTCPNIRSVSAKIIEPYIWNIVKKTITDPRLILKQTKRYKEKKQAEQEREDYSSIERELKKVEKGETRLITAHREDIITKDQLNEQLEMVKGLKTNLEKKLEELKEGCEVIDYDLIKGGLENLCRDLTAVINSLNPQEKREVLKLLLSEIVIEKKNLLIKGSVPVFKTKSSIAPTSVL